MTVPLINGWQLSCFYVFFIWPPGCLALPVGKMALHACLAARPHKIAVYVIFENMGAANVYHKIFESILGFKAC